MRNKKEPNNITPKCFCYFDCFGFFFTVMCVWNLNIVLLNLCLLRFCGNENRKRNVRSKVYKIHLNLFWKYAITMTMILGDCKVFFGEMKFVCCVFTRVVLWLVATGRCSHCLRGPCSIAFFCTFYVWNWIHCSNY